jgi:RNA-directed DNA polymerase
VIGEEPANTLKLRTLHRKLYGKANTEPAFRFYVLYYKIYREDVIHHTDALARANVGASGVDGETFGAIEAARCLACLAGLRQALRTRIYRPAPVRRVLFPKPGGGERPLGIPTIRDRVAQAAAELVLEQIVEADLEPMAYGYRLGRSGSGAIEAVHTLLCRGYTDVVDADLSKYLDTAAYCSLVHEDGSKSPGC